MIVESFKCSFDKESRVAHESTVELMRNIEAVESALKDDKNLLQEKVPTYQIQ